MRRLPNLAKLDGHQCMATEVNLTDAQSELQKNSETTGGDASKFDRADDDEEEEGEEGDEEEEEEEEQEDDEEKEEGDEEEEEGEVDEEEEVETEGEDHNKSSESQGEVTSNPVTHALEPVAEQAEEIGTKEE